MTRRSLEGSVVTRRSLEGSVVVVTGASSGIGRASALAFAQHRTRLVLAARSGAELAIVAGQCRDRGAEATFVPYDAADADGVESVARHAVDTYGRIDFWVQVPAVLIVGPFGEEPMREVDRLIDVNVRGPVLAARVAMAQFSLQRYGTLIFVSSILGVVPSPAAPTYAMSKFALHGLALSLRQSVVGTDIRVATVMPGPVDTPLFAKAANHSGRPLRAVPPAHAPERIAATIVSCARRPRRHATSGVGMRVVLAAHRLAPRATEFAIAQTSARLLTRRGRVPDTAGTLFEPPATAQVHGGWRRGRTRRHAGEWVGMRAARRGAPEPQRQ